MGNQSQWHDLVVASARDKSKVIQLLARALSLDSSPECRGSLVVQAMSYERGKIRIAGGAPVAPLSAELSVAEVLDHSASPHSLGVYALARLFQPVLNATAAEQSLVRQPLTPTAELLLAVPQPVTTTVPGDIIKNVIAGRDVAVFGKSASGKTVSALQSAKTLSEMGWSVSWLDLSEPDRDAWDAIFAVVSAPIDQPLALFVDDAQAQPLELQRLKDAVGCLCEWGVAFRIVTMAWESARPIIIASWPAMAIINSQSDATLALMIRSALGGGTTEVVRQHIGHIAAGDLVVASLMLEFIKANDRLPRSEELTSIAFSRAQRNGVVSDTAIEIVYRTAALSQFEIDIGSHFIRSISPFEHDELVRSRVLRASGNYLSIGHRSLARLLLPALAERIKGKLHDLPSPNAIAVEYLQKADPRQLLATLERLDMARINRSGNDQHGTKYLVELWDTLGILLRSLDKQARVDPKWSDDTGSAIFAFKSLAQFNYDSAIPTHDCVRQRWCISDENNLPFTEGPPTNERKDFGEIGRCMSEEESETEIPIYAEKATDVDLDRMHRTWVLGLLLGFESRSPAFSPERVALLKVIARNQQLANGSFYPSRVPWVTARVLIGLSEAGETVESSDVVRAGCNWLLKEMPNGPFDFGAWPPFTGSWNTTPAITAMCVNALIRCGISAAHDQIKLASRYLDSSRSEWSKPKHEIDAAFAIETYLLTTPHWRGMQKELSALLFWAKNPSIWLNVVKDAHLDKDESVKIPFIATSLVGIIWSIVRLELPLLLEDFSTGAYLYDLEIYEPFKKETADIVRCLNEVLSCITSNIDDRLALIQQRPDMAAGATGAQLERLRRLASEGEALLKRAKSLERAISAEVYDREIRKIYDDVDRLGLSVIGAGWKGVR